MTVAEARHRLREYARHVCATGTEVDTLMKRADAYVLAVLDEQAVGNTALRRQIKSLRR